MWPETAIRKHPNALRSQLESSSHLGPSLGLICDRHGTSGQGLLRPGNGSQRLPAHAFGPDKFATHLHEADIEPDGHRRSPPKGRRHPSPFPADFALRFLARREESRRQQEMTVGRHQVMYRPFGQPSPAAHRQQASLSPVVAPAETASANAGRSFLLAPGPTWLLAQCVRGYS